MVEITYQMVLSTLQTVALVVGISYYIMVLRNQQKSQKLTLETRRASFLTQISLDIYSKESLFDYYELASWEWEDLEDYDSKYGSNESLTLWMRTFLRFDLVGRLLREGLIDTVAVVQMIGSGSVAIWHQFEEVIMRGRTQMGSDWMADLEYLVSEVTKVYDPTYTSRFKTKD